MRHVFVAALLLSASGFSTAALAESQHTCQGNANCGTTYNIQEGDQINKGGNASAGAVAGAAAGAIAGAAAGVANVNTVAPIIAPVNAPVIAPVIKPEIEVKPTISPNISPNISPVISPDIDVKNTNVSVNVNATKIGVSNSVSNTNTVTNNNEDNNTNNANQEVTFEAQKRAPVNTAYAAPLAVGEDTCMGSSSIGGQGVGFGVSIGTSWTDDNCQRLKNSRQLQALGYHRAAVALMCLNDDVATAMEAAGTPCRVKKADARSELPAQVDARNLSPEPVQVASAEEPRHYTVSMAPVPDVPSKKLKLRTHRR